jgi:hypothetical protein
MRARDNQRQKVYNWERTLRNSPANKTLTLDECKNLIKKVCQRYSKAIPYVSDGRGTSYARGGANRINLPKWARETIFVLHELAHSIQLVKGEQIGNDRPAWHGAEFARLFIELLAWQKIAPKAELMKSARQHRIRIATAAACVKPDKWQISFRRDIDKLAERYQERYGLTKSEVYSAIN